MRNISGKSKGFAYVQFADEASVPKALAMDRHTSAAFGFRPVYVNRCEPRNKDAPAPASEPAGPKYSDAIERNKLYVFCLLLICLYSLSCMRHYPSHNISSTATLCCLSS